MQTRLIEGNRLHVSFAGNWEKLFPTRIKMYKNNILCLVIFYGKDMYYVKSTFFLYLTKINFRAVKKFHTGSFPTNVFGLVSRSCGRLPSINFISE